MIGGPFVKNILRFFYPLQAGSLISAVHVDVIPVADLALIRRQLFFAGMFPLASR